MGLPVLAYQETAETRRDNDVHHGLSYADAYLVKGSRRGKAGEDADDRHETERGESRGRAKHVLLSNAELKEPVWAG